MCLFCTESLTSKLKIFKCSVEGIHYFIQPGRKLDPSLVNCCAQIHPRFAGLLLFTWKLPLFFRLETLVSRSWLAKGHVARGIFLGDMLLGGMWREREAETHFSDGLSFVTCRAVFAKTFCCGDKVLPPQRVTRIQQVLFHGAVHTALEPSQLHHNFYASIRFVYIGFLPMCTL